MMYGIFIAVGLAASRFTDVSRVAQELYKLWETARFPVVTSMVPVKPLAVVMAGLLYGPLMCGDVDHPGHREKVERDITKIDNRQRQFVYGIAGSVEGAWEPQCSRRVQHWQRALDESAEGGVNGLVSVFGSVGPPQKLLPLRLIRHPRLPASCGSILTARAQGLIFLFCSGTRSPRRSTSL